MIKKTMKARWVLSLLGVATATLVGGVALASSPGREGAEEERPGKATPATTSATAAKETTVTIGNVAVGVDPKTGELRPLTKAQAARLASEMRRLFKPRTLERVAHPDGSLSAVVAPNVLRFSVARVTRDGTLSRTCVAGEEAALELLSDAPPKPKARAQEE